MEQYLLGIDIGTSACKTALFNKEGTLLLSKSEKYPTYYPETGWAEQNPHDWWNAVRKTLLLTLEQTGISPGEIAGIGVDSQSWAAVFLNAQGEVLTKAPIWLDTRAQAVCTRLNQQLGPDNIFSVAGNPLQPTYTTAKVLWLKEAFPDIFAKAKTVLQASSFIIYKLTGQITQDLSHSYGWHCFHMKTGQWDYDIAKELGIPTHLLPPLFPCHQIVGHISEQAAAQTGLLAGTPVVAGGVDAACATLGAGVIHNGECQEQGGQAGGISICINHYKADPRLILSHHVVPGHWLLQGGTTGGGGVMRWLEQELAGEERIAAQKTGKSPLTQLNELADQIPPGSDGLVFLPYMSGERTPIWDPNAKGVYYGLDFSKTKGHLIRSAMEGIAYSLRHNIDIAEEIGCQISNLRATGGSANSLLWTQIKADITGKNFLVPYSDTATVRGTAILAGVGTGLYKNFDEAVKETIHINRIHRSDPRTQAVYTANYKIYRELYEDLKDLMHKTGRT